MLVGAFVVVGGDLYRRHMLTDTEITMLDMERSWWKAQGRKDEVIRHRPT